jgi:hypothetical protein
VYDTRVPNLAAIVSSWSLVRDEVYYIRDIINMAVFLMKLAVNN